jgi:hypothetical protein
LISVQEVLRCFRSPRGLPLRDPRRWARGFPHSDIDGSQGVGPLPVASRSRTASFIGSPTPGHSPFAVCRFERTRALARVISQLDPVNLLRCPRWRCGGSNPEPPPCKGGALPVELHPRDRVTSNACCVLSRTRSRLITQHALLITSSVGLSGLEPETSVLSGLRSNQLS